MRLGVRFRCLFSVVLGVEVVTMRAVRVMRSLLMIAGFVMFCGFFMVTRRMFMMLSGLMVVFCCFLGHLASPLQTVRP